MRVFNIVIAMCLCTFIWMQGAQQSSAKSDTILHSKREQASEASCTECSKLPEHSETERQRTYAKKANWYDAAALTKNNALHMIPASFADLAQELSPSVVNISSTQKINIVTRSFPDMPNFPEGSPFKDFFQDFMGRRGGEMPSMPSASLGSGFIIDAQKGYIITNNHVVRDAQDIRVTFADDVTVDAKLIGTDDKTDIAVLQVENAKDMKLKAVSFGDSDSLRVGDWTVAIGNPFGLGGSVTAGIVSARARDIHSGPYDDYIQVDAAINRGNSGGPLFNLNGEVVGINAAIYSPTGGSVGIGFSIPSSLAKPVIDQIIKYGRTRRGWLGVRVQKVTLEIAETLGLEEEAGVGALIASVNEKGPAADSDLESGDIILEVNDRKIKEMRSLPKIIADYEVGTKAKIAYWRNNKKHTTYVKIGELEKAEEEGLIKSKESSSSSQNNGVEIEMMGFTLKELDDSALRRTYNISVGTKGVLISDVVPLSEAARKGLQKGDVIVEINQSPVSKAQDVVDMIDKAKKDGRKSVLLLINNSDNMRFVALRIKYEEE